MPDSTARLSVDPAQFATPDFRHRRAAFGSGGSSNCSPTWPAWLATGSAAVAVEPSRRHDKFGGAAP